MDDSSSKHDRRQLSQLVELQDYLTLDEREWLRQALGGPSLSARQRARACDLEQQCIERAALLAV